jgi:prepilin-type N-terminal cleavage/methylation domain-containing protein
MNVIHTNRNSVNTRAFTLIEVLVSVALFSIVMVVALGALVALSSAVKRAEALDTATNNLAAALDSMSRAIRTGTTYHCGSGGTLGTPADCPNLASSASSFTFQDSSNPSNQVTYCLSNPGANTCNSSTSCGSGSCTILRAKAVGGGGASVPLTAPEVNVSSLKFIVTGSPSTGAGDYVQPRVTLLVVGTITINQNITSNFNLQTTVAQHLYDI